MTTQPNTVTITLTPDTIAGLPRPVAAWLATEIARESREGLPTTVSMTMFLALLDRQESTAPKQRRVKTKSTT